MKPPAGKTDPGSKGDGKERRRAHRTGVTIEARWRVYGEAGMALRRGSGTLLDLSPGGLCAELGADVAPGVIVKLEFILPGVGPISALAQVAWIEPSGKGVRAGCRTVAIRPEEAEGLQQYLERQKPKN